MAPARFDLYECRECRTGFCDPLVSDDRVYEHIYLQRHVLPGYNRYERYREQCASQPDPLAWLAKEEDAYWAVAETAAALLNNARVLDVGCGLGYLTFALESAGHSTIGLDVSETAVERARATFAARFELGAAEDIPPAWGCFDLIVACELVEHVTDPADLIAALMARLEPDGSLLLTTPNRDAYDANARWSEDPPPVHLWWFSEQSFTRLARDHAWSCSFVDFTPYAVVSGVQTRRPSSRDEHRLSRAGRLLQGPGAPLGPRASASLGRRWESTKRRADPPPTDLNPRTRSTMAVLLAPSAARSAQA